MAEICNSRAQTPFGGNGRAYRVSAMVLFDKQGSCGKTETDIAIIWKTDTETDTDFWKTDQKTENQYRLKKSIPTQL